MSLDADIDDDGVTFRSTYDGATVRLTPEDAVAVQQELDADIQMVLDVCPELPAPPEVVRLAAERTLAWAERAREVASSDQALFGIVQGGIDCDLRAEVATRVVEIGFDGYAIGGLSVGETRPELLAALDAAIGELPAAAPRYLMGVGDPMTIVESIGRGVDMFDCVLPTRLARHGTVLTSDGRLNLRNASFRGDDRPLDETCACPVCERWSRAYLRYLLTVLEPTAGRLVTLHNLSFLFGLVDRAREAIVDGTFDELRAGVAAVWA